MVQASEWLNIGAVRQKIATVAPVAEGLLRAGGGIGHRFSPPSPARDAEVLDIKLHPPKPGLASNDGQARLLHDLANIELQAMELAIRTLAEFPEAPEGFREQLAEVAIEESRHLKLCVDGLEELGQPWGSFPVHTSLWDAAGTNDLLERILVVHRHMEGSGLDAGSRILTRLSGVKAPLVRDIVGVIVREEIGHVAFGSRWYRSICRTRGIDPDTHFREHFPALLRMIPRTEKPAYNLRREAGFSEAELATIQLVIESTDYSQKRPH